MPDTIHALFYGNNGGEEFKGVIKVGFTIGIDGNVKKVILIKGIDASIDAEVIKLFQVMPNWKPATQNGRNVEYYKEMVIPFFAYLSIKKYNKNNQ